MSVLLGYNLHETAVWTVQMWITSLQQKSKYIMVFCAEKKRSDDTCTTDPISSSTCTFKISLPKSFFGGEGKFPYPERCQASVSDCDRKHHDTYWHNICPITSSTQCFPKRTTFHLASKIFIASVHTFVDKNLRDLPTFSIICTRRTPLFGLPRFSPEMISSSLSSNLPSAKSLNKSMICRCAYKYNQTSININVIKPAST